MVFSGEEDEERPLRIPSQTLLVSPVCGLCSQSGRADPRSACLGPCPAPTRAMCMSLRPLLLCLRHPFSTSGLSLPGLVQRDLKGSVRSSRWVHGKLSSEDPYMGYVPAPLVCRVLSWVGLAKPYHFQGVKGHCEKQVSWRPPENLSEAISQRQRPDKCLGRRSGSSG